MSSSTFALNPNQYERAFSLAYSDPTTFPSHSCHGPRVGAAVFSKESELIYTSFLKVPQSFIDPEPLLCAGHCAKCCICIILMNPGHNLVNR